MYIVRGLITNKIYAEGTKADVFRQLQQEYPSCKTNIREDKSERSYNRSIIYEEPLKIIKKVLIKQKKTDSPASKISQK